ncbi:hypothetical protein BC826DRAFT_1136668 [Russula brevipes]|nr:hypothetical protein BC826DRAFT_1136668 [Russula brevipes]
MWTLFCTLPVPSTNDKLAFQKEGLSNRERAHIRAFHYATIARPRLIVVHGPANGHTAHFGHHQSVHAVYTALTVRSGSTKKGKRKRKKKTTTTTTTTTTKDFQWARELGEEDASSQGKLGGYPNMHRSGGTGRPGQERAGKKLLRHRGHGALRTYRLEARARPWEALAGERTRVEGASLCGCEMRRHERLGPPVVLVWHNYLKGTRNMDGREARELERGVCQPVEQPAPPTALTRRMQGVRGAKREKNNAQIESKDGRWQIAGSVGVTYLSPKRADREALNSTSGWTDPAVEIHRPYSGPVICCHGRRPNSALRKRMGAVVSNEGEPFPRSISWNAHRQRDSKARARADLIGRSPPLHEYITSTLSLPRGQMPRRSCAPARSLARSPIVARRPVEPKAGTGNLVRPCAVRELTRVAGNKGKRRGGKGKKRERERLKWKRPTIHGWTARRARGEKRRSGGGDGDGDGRFVIICGGGRETVGEDPPRPGHGSKIRHRISKAGGANYRPSCVLWPSPSPESTEVLATN